jgi:hypothetical protein
MSTNTFIKTIDNSSLLQNALNLALQPYATMTYVSTYVSTSIQGLATSNSVNSSIANALVPFSNTITMNTAIASAIAPLQTSTSVNLSIANALLPFSNTIAMNSAISNALVPYSNTITINSAITASSLLPKTNIWTGVSNTFNNGIKLNSNLDVQLSGGTYSYTLELGVFPTNETIYLWDDPARSIIPVSSGIIGRTYRILTNLAPTNTLYSDAFNSSQLRTGGVYLDPYDSITNNTKYGLLTIRVADVLVGNFSNYDYKAWNIPFVLGTSPITIYLHTVGYPSSVNPFTQESVTGNTAIPYQPLTNYAKVTIKPPGQISLSPTEISYLKGTTSNIQSQIGNVATNLLSATNIWSGSNIFTGIFNSVQSADSLSMASFNTTPTFSITQGMVYVMTTTSTAITSLSLTNIPITPLQTYVFTFLCQPSTPNSPWYLKPPTNFMNITAVGRGTSIVPINGISSIVFPSTYVYILQTITVLNISTSSTPNFVALFSATAY